MLAALNRVLLPALCCAVVCAIGPACGAAARENGAVEYAVSAADNYEKGMKRLEDEEWQEAAKFFAFVKARFPYSKYAVLADLRIADAAAGAEQYLDAIDTYRQFIRFHPTHELVENGYASFKIGECYYHMLPDDWFLVPPSYEKDLSSAIDAGRELSTFMRIYPKSTFVPKAKELYGEVAHVLASHEWYVASFYWRKQKPMGTVLRLRTLLKNYPEAGYDEEALWLLGQAYVAVGRPDDARKSWSTLVERFPAHARAHEAKDALARLPIAPASAPASAPAKPDGPS
jgi:outer membrane protein assembly factor BamD